MAGSGVFRHAAVGEKLVSANAKFATDLYQQLLETTKENVFFSPASISIALAMTYLGARGKTAEQMKTVMQFHDIPDDHLHPTFEDIQTQLNNHADKFKLLVANRLFAEQTYNFLQEFLSKTKQHYQAELAAVDFRVKFDESREEINSWVESKTEKKITNLLPAGSLNSLTRLILVNAIYFKGDWAKKFKESKTKEGNFIVNADEKIKVQFMSQKEKFKHGYNQKLATLALALPYVDNHITMFVLLPQKIDGLAELESQLSSEHLSDPEGVFRMNESEIIVRFPRFKLEQSFGLGDTLRTMGMEDLFAEGKADLSGLDGGRNLYVSKVLHKAYIEVNEEGSEAAAATAVQISLMCMPMEFFVNHPFLFFIRDNATRTILFFGRVVKP